MEKQGSRTLEILASGLGAGVVVFLLTYYLIAVPAQHAAEETVEAARQLSSVEAAKTDVITDLEILRRFRPRGRRARTLVAEGGALFQRGNSAFDKGDGRYVVALRYYNAALKKLRAAYIAGTRSRPPDLVITAPPLNLTAQEPPVSLKAQEPAIHSAETPVTPEVMHQSARP